LLIVNVLTRPVGPGLGHSGRWLVRSALAWVLAVLGLAMLIVTPAFAGAGSTAGAAGRTTGMAGRTAASAGPAARTAIAAGGAFSCDLQAGRAYCWGNNDYGQLGDGSSTASSFPMPVEAGGVLAGKSLTQISAGAAHACVLDRAGAAFCWGYDGTGALGDGSTAYSSDIPVAVDTSGVLAGKALSRIAAGYNHTCATDRAGAAYCWGDNSRGELGDGSTVSSSVPVAVQAGGALVGQRVTHISAAFHYTCATDRAGAGFCWGAGGDGVLGNGTTSDSSVPVAVQTTGVLAGETLTGISTGSSHVCAVDSVGHGYCWGSNANGELGDGTTTNSSVPGRVLAPGPLAHGSLARRSLARRSLARGQFARGSFARGPLASGSLTGRRLTRISAGLFHTCALTRAGAAYCWGSGYVGELGTGSVAGSSVPVAVYAGGVLARTVLTRISAADTHTCATDRAGAAYCWGANYTSQLGDDTSTERDRPVLAGPAAPAQVMARPGDRGATVSWRAPASLDGGALTGYTATARPGGWMCATKQAARCTITGLRNCIRYRVTVVVRSTAGRSGESTAATVTPGRTRDPGERCR
jgi:alpha-tubulin suppressor-like RCC1 family protein